MLRPLLPLALVAAMVATLTGGAPAHAAAPPPPLPASLGPISFGGPFTLVDHTGAPRTDRDFHGRFMLVFFGYTNCPDICPTGLTTMAAALDALGARAAQVQPLFITVDPERDTEVLADYVAHFHPRLVGLSGSQAQVGAAVRAYRVHRGKVVTSADAGADDYLVTHSSLTFLMDPDGAFLTLFPHGTTAPAMATAIGNYLH